MAKREKNQALHENTHLEYRMVNPTTPRGKGSQADKFRVQNSTHKQSTMNSESSPKSRIHLSQSEMVGRRSLDSVFSGSRLLRETHFYTRRDGGVANATVCKTVGPMGLS